MTEIDRLAIDEFGVGLAQMMELAGARTWPDWLSICWAPSRAAW